MLHGVTKSLRPKLNTLCHGGAFRLRVKLPRPSFFSPTKPVGCSVQTLSTEAEPNKSSGILSIFDRERTIAPPVGENF